MADSPNKGAFQADIPADAVEEALRSVERVRGRGVPAGASDPVPGTPEGEGTELALETSPEPDAGASERERSLGAQLELSQEKARETLERLKEAHDRHVRAVADLENYKKRAQKERDEVLKYGNEKLLKDLFPVVDGLDRALAAAEAAGPEEAGSARRRGEGETRAIDTPLGKGVRLVRASLEQALARHGVTSFSALGQPFDPARHEALLQVPGADQAPGTVVMEHARGFLLHGRLVRPAMVGVSAPAEAKDPGPGAGEGEGEGGEG
jgi:molecular chaperone GrpE